MRKRTWFLLLALLLAACGGLPVQSPPQPTAAPPSPPTAPPVATATAPPAAIAPATTALTVAPTAAATAAPTAVPPAATATPDNTVATPKPGALNTSFVTALALGKDPIKTSVKESVLYYKLDVPRGGIVTAQLTVEAGSPMPVQMVLYNELQNWVVDIRVPVGKTDKLSYVFDAKGGGTVFLTLAGEANVTLQGQGAAQNDGASGKDAGNDVPAALAIKPGAYTGVLGGDDGTDIYSVDLAKTGLIIAVALKSKGAQGDTVRLNILDDKEGQMRDGTAVATDPTPVTVKYMLATNQGGRWYFRFDGSGEYSFDIQVTLQNDGGSGKDAPDDRTKALPVMAATFRGATGDSDATDAYRIAGSLGRTVRVKLTGGDDTLQVELFDLAGNLLDQTQLDAGTRNAEVKATGTGDYVFEVSGGDVTYEVTIVP